MYLVKNDIYDVLKKQILKNFHFHLNQSSTYHVRLKTVVKLVVKFAVNLAGDHT